ncbi:MAG: hypothetical protein IKN71_08020 [Alphaproteobacteria bacterium]|nr:hypothetical protein [Alphaproteobacteria bacterium]
MSNIDPTENKQKQVLKLFKYIPLFSIKKRGGKTAFYLLGLPIWKIRRMENENLIKYYFLNIPLFRLYKTFQPDATDIMLQEINKFSAEFKKQITEQKNILLKYNKRFDKQEAKLAKLNKLTELSEQITEQNRQLTDCYSNLTEKVEDRMKVHHAEILERIDNLPRK